MAAPMTDEEIVAALAEALRDIVVPGYHKRSPRSLAAALLPVVRRVAEQRAAEELLAAADWLRPHVAIEASVAAFLRARAAGLTATPNHGTDATT